MKKQAFAIAIAAIYLILMAIVPQWMWLPTMIVAFPCIVWLQGDLDAPEAEEGIRQIEDWLNSDEAH